jgi:cytochrome c oxidase subunit 2
MYKWIVAVLFFGACALGIGVLLNELPQAPSEEELAADANALKITATNWEFDKPEYVVELGSTKTVKLVNEQGLHGIAIEDLGIELQGATLEQEVTFDKAGTYEIKCIVLCGQGHADMTAKLVVKEGAEAPEGEAAPAESAH